MFPEGLSRVSISPVLTVFGGQRTVQFLDDAARVQRRVHYTKVRGAGGGEDPAPQGIFGQGEVPGQRGWSGPALIRVGI